MLTDILPPPPGTVVAQVPPPPAVDDAIRLVSDGVDVEDAVRQLSAAYSGAELRAAWLWWVRRMPKRRWDDHRASAVLQLLERSRSAAARKLPA